MRNTNFKKYAGISKRSQRGGLENRLPKRHGGSNPSSCATFTLENPSVFKGFLYVFRVDFKNSPVEPKGIFKLIIYLAVSFGLIFVVFYEKIKAQNPLLYKAFPLFALDITLDVKQFASNAILEIFFYN